MFLARARKGAQNGWRGIGPYLAEKRRTIYNRQPANVRTLTRQDEIVEKDRDQNGSTIEDVMATATEEFVVRRKTEKELKTKIIRFPKS